MAHKKAEAIHSYNLRRPRHAADMVAVERMHRERHAPIVRVYVVTSTVPTLHHHDKRILSFRTRKTARTLRSVVWGPKRVSQGRHTGSLFSVRNTDQVATGIVLAR